MKVEKLEQIAQAFEDYLPVFDSLDNCQCDIHQRWIYYCFTVNTR